MMTRWPVWVLAVSSLLACALILGGLAFGALRFAGEPTPATTGRLTDPAAQLAPYLLREFRDDIQADADHWCQQQFGTTKQIRTRNRDIVFTWQVCAESVIQINYSAADTCDPTESADVTNICTRTMATTRQQLCNLAWDEWPGETESPGPLMHRYCSGEGES